MGEFVTRRLIPSVMDRSERPLEVVVNFGDMKINKPSDESGGISSTSAAPNAIIFNAPGSTLDMTGSGVGGSGASGASIVDARALRQRMMRGSGKGGLGYVTLPRRVGVESTYYPGEGRYYSGYDRGRVDIPLRRPERMLGFERGGGRLVRGVCAVCQARSLLNRRGCCDQCDHRVFSFPGPKDRYNMERDGLDYSTIRVPLLDEELSDVSSTPRTREFRYKGFGRSDGYGPERYYYY
ncbi:hypothetical protein B0T16DRAFT_406643 [Cercophora newfieldiana]|uniref:Uncharacterized protein n=1 Tax=Cercophora newfieldiana TaxID=92897 RepID=A0AA40CVZ2_9PEZI|nr:hypothetical protein B0T16DRAFT_406643 [Cercophora newfieldiana]